MLVIEPVSNDRANSTVEQWHRHLGRLPDCQLTFCYAVYEVLKMHCTTLSSAELLGVAIVGNPSGRPTGADRKLILELRRVCFKPGVVFHKLRRYYHPKVRADEMSLRTIPVIVRDLVGPPAFLQGSLVPAYTVPSYFVRCAEFYTRQQYSNIQRLWTSVQEHERGRYLEAAGYRLDKVVKSRGPHHAAKHRYALDL